jgi:hypothetical protein
MTDHNPLLRNILTPLTSSSASANHLEPQGRTLDATLTKEAAFEAALKTLDVRSVFDIIRQPKAHFCEQFSELCEHHPVLNELNPELTYDHAMCYAVQIGRLYREEQVSSSDIANSGFNTPDSPKYQDLFNEQWDEFCKVGAIAAIDSPVAYLRSLYRLITDVIESGDDGSRPKIKLDTRRPDLKELLIDQQSTFTPLPMLNIVNDVLSKSIESFLDKDADLVAQEMMNKRHPFLFPYHFAHQQCQLSLGQSKHPLGSINYRISQPLPTGRDARNEYGQHAHASTIAQTLLAGLSPEQQRIVTEPTPFPDAADVPPDVERAFFKRHYGVEVSPGHENPLTTLGTFMTQTGSSAEQVEALLATRQYSPTHSPNCLSPDPVHTRAGTTSTLPSSSDYGACYVNGAHSVEAQKPATASEDNSLKLVVQVTDDGTTVRLANTSLQRFDRLQRMIRLQRWMNISFAELDTLIVAAMRAEGEANLQMALNDNTLRTLGVFRYLSGRYDITAEEFAALLHDLSPYADKNRMPLFDEVFNNPVLFDTPLTLDQTEFETSSSAPEDQRTVYQLCASLGLQPTATSLERLAHNTRTYVGTLRRSLATVSSFYRQARIARLLSLTAQDGWAVADALGSDAYHQALARGTLRTEGNDPDILDALMQMDWAVSWLKQSAKDITTVRTQIGLDPSALTPTQALVDRLNQLHHQSSQSRVTYQHIRDLNLPNNPSNSIDWFIEIRRTLVSGSGLVNALPLQPVDDVRAQLDEALLSLIEPMVLEPGAKTEARNALCQLLLGAHDAQAVLIERLLQELAELQMDQAALVLHWSGLSTPALLTLLEEAVNDNLLTVEHFDPTLLSALQTVVRHAHIAIELDLSELALRLFLVSPSWLGAPMHTQTPSLASLYLLERYAHLVHEADVPDAGLLNYLTLANAPGAARLDTEALASELARLLNWSKSELLTHVLTLPDHKAVNLAHVDWLYRCKQTGDDSGLSAASLQLALTLNVQSPLEQWQAMGNAAMAAIR